MSLEFVRGFVY